jgi:hypothetical protein
MLIVELVFGLDTPTCEAVSDVINDELRQRKRAIRKRDQPTRLPESGREMYGSLFTAEEQVALAGGVDSNDLKQELELLRVLIRRGVAEGVDLETVSRSIARLAQALRVQHVVRGQAARNLDEALARVLEEIGNELGL